MKILLPINDWTLGQAQVDAVIPYLRFPHTTVLLVSVVEPMVAHTYRYGYGRLVEELNATQRRCAENLLEKMKARLCGFCPQARIESRAFEGEAVSGLLAVISNEQVDLVVVAQRRKHPLLKLFSRSVSDALTACACCSTVVVKPQVWQGYGDNKKEGQVVSATVAYPLTSETVKELASVERT